MKIRGANRSLIIILLAGSEPTRMHGRVLDRTLSGATQQRERIKWFNITQGTCTTPTRKCRSMSERGSVAARHSDHLLVREAQYLISFSKT